MKILIAEDEEAWKALPAHFPVLITDFQMPDLDGLSLTRLIRAKPRDSYTYVIIFVSGMTTTPDSIWIPPGLRHRDALPGPVGQADLLAAGRRQEVHHFVLLGA